MIKIQAVLVAVIASCALASNDRRPNDILQRGETSGWSDHGRSLKGTAPGDKAAPGKAKGPLNAGKAVNGKTAPGAPPYKGNLTPWPKRAAETSQARSPNRMPKINPRRQR